MDISIQTDDNISLADAPFIASAKGLSTARTITVDPSIGFQAGTDIVNGYLLAGVPLGLVTGGNYGLYDNAASDGRQTCVGFLKVKKKISAGGTSVKLGADLLWEGVVRLSRLPRALDSAGQADLAAKFLFV